MKIRLSLALLFTIMDILISETKEQHCAYRRPPHFIRHLSRFGGTSRISTSGFTLVELLTVVAIIGLLSSILTVRVRQSQLDAYDTSIMQTFDTLRVKAEIDRDANGNYDAVCVESGGASGNSILTAAGDYANINNAIKGNNGGTNVLCNEGAGSNSFAAWSPLRAVPDTYWCIDWTFNVKQVTGVLPPDATECQ